MIAQTYYKLVGTGSSRKTSASISQENNFVGTS